MGTITMKMIRSTSSTSISGVTFGTAESEEEEEEENAMAHLCLRIGCASVRVQFRYAMRSSAAKAAKGKGGET
jgi:hypothetical protein